MIAGKTTLCTSDPMDVYNRAKAARPAAPANPPATRWPAPEPALVVAAAAEELPPAEDAVACMLEVMVDPAELVVVTTLPLMLPLLLPLMLPPDVELVVKVEPAELVVVMSTIPPAPGPPVEVMLPLKVDV